VTERPRIALRQPRSLQPEQLGQLTVCTPAVPHPVSAWILWEDGVEELVPAQAIAWTITLSKTALLSRPPPGNDRMCP
jgi:hypothetical protein